jgi:hypothetical protein
MSYERLAARLIETQQAVFGARAVDVARSVPGLDIDEDGEVTGIDPGEEHERDVIVALVEEYVEIMGESAHDRLDEAAAEFEDDLVLPETLGGPAELPLKARATVDSGDTQSDEGQSGPRVDPDEVVSDIWNDGEAADDQAEDGPDPEAIDIESVYVTVSDGDRWETPVPIRTAIIEALAEVSDLTDEDVDHLSVYVNPDRIVHTVEGDDASPLSFTVEGHEVTVHPSGDVSVE